jgi:hypothetical protein
MQTSHDDICAAPPTVIRDPVRAVCRGDVNLDDDKIGRVLEGEPLDMLVLYFSASSCSSR